MYVPIHYIRGESLVNSQLIRWESYSNKHTDGQTIHPLDQCSPPLLLQSKGLRSKKLRGEAEYSYVDVNKHSIHVCGIQIPREKIAKILLAVASLWAMSLKVEKIMASQYCSSQPVSPWLDWTYGPLWQFPASCYPLCSLDLQRCHSQRTPQKYIFPVPYTHGLCSQLTRMSLVFVNFFFGLCWSCLICFDMNAREYLSWTNIASEIIRVNSWWISS